MKIREVDSSYLLNWPFYSSIAREWSDVKCLIALDLNVPVGILVASAGRIIHVYVRGDIRHGGVGKKLVEYHMVTCAQVGIETTALVSVTNLKGLCFFIKCGLVYWGVGIYKESKGFLLRSTKPAESSNDQVADREELFASTSQDMLNKILIMETPPTVI